VIRCATDGIAEFKASERYDFRIGCFIADLLRYLDGGIRVDGGRHELHGLFTCTANLMNLRAYALYGVSSQREMIRRADDFPLGSNVLVLSI
jgi:hypothetical protein